MMLKLGESESWELNACMKRETSKQNSKYSGPSVYVLCRQSDFNMNIDNFLASVHIKSLMSLITTPIRKINRFLCRSCPPHRCLNAIFNCFVEILFFLTPLGLLVQKELHKHP